MAVNTLHDFCLLTIYNMIHDLVLDRDKGFNRAETCRLEGRIFNRAERAEITP